VWREVKVNGAPPSKRLTHSAVVANGCMYVFGGWDGHNFLNDLHEFNLSAFVSHVWMRWTIVVTTGVVLLFFLQQPTPGVKLSCMAKPRPNETHSGTVGDLGRRRGVDTRCSAVSYSNSMYIFGGYDGRNRLNDLHEFDFGAWRGPWARWVADAGGSGAHVARGGAALQGARRALLPLRCAARCLPSCASDRGCSARVQHQHVRVWRVHGHAEHERHAGLQPRCRPLAPPSPWAGPV
jgi:hypothetical protein